LPHITKAPFLTTPAWAKPPPIGLRINGTSGIGSSISSWTSQFYFVTILIFKEGWDKIIFGGKKLRCVETVCRKDKNNAIFLSVYVRNARALFWLTVARKNKTSKINLILVLNIENYI
jgi:hypothetical protein